MRYCPYCGFKLVETNDLMGFVCSNIACPNFHNKISKVKKHFHNFDEWRIGQNMFEESSGPHIIK